MPARKSQGGDPPSDSRRKSLRRLSSIASLQTLNLFSRRRSNNATDGSVPSSSSAVSLTASTLAVTSQHPQACSSSDIPSSPPQRIQPVPPPPMLQDRSVHTRKDYMALSDDPDSGLPRSKTFSNLPVPTRTRKTSEKLQLSRSHARTPYTRIPSPPSSNRKHSISGLASLRAGHVPQVKKLVRSDTEPLLDLRLDSPYDVGLSTAFKENISPGSLKLLPSRPPHDEQSPKDVRVHAHGHVANLGWNGANTNHQSSLGESKINLLPKSKFASSASSFPPRKSSLTYASSPILARSLQGRPPTPGKPQPVQRWNSQPVLSSDAGPRSFHGVIKQARLMSARQAPTPPPPKTPLSDQAVKSSRARGLSNASSLRRVPEHLVVQAEQPLSPKSRGRAVTPSASTFFRGHITTAEPISYWTGRFSALNDHYRTEDMLASSCLFPVIGRSSSPTASLESKTWKPRSQADALETPTANAARMRRVVEHLAGLCATDEAKESFRSWQVQLAAALQMPELVRPVYGKGCALEMSLQELPPLEGDLEAGSRSAARKMSLIDRLLGRARKSLTSS